MKRHFLVYCIGYCILFCLFHCLTAPALPAAASGPDLTPGILLLTSYHQGDSWTDRIVAGFAGVFPPEGIRLFIEHLDQRRFPGQAHAPEFLAYLARKYRDTPLRLLVSADDAALDFLLAHRQALFPGLPLVFCGVNDCEPGRLAGQSGVTGVCEAPDVLGTLELALHLLPDTRIVAVLAADTNSSHWTNLERLRRAVRAMGSRLRVLELVNATLEQAQAVLAGLPQDAVALRLAPFFHPDGAGPPLAEDVPALTLASRVPVFALWDFDMGTGIMGGRMVNGTDQGRSAGELARRILAGEAPEAIAVADAPNQALLDQTVLTRFAVPQGNVPPGTRLLHEEPPVYERYKLAIWSGGAALAILLPAAILLAMALMARRRAEGRLRASQDRYRELVESANSLILRFDRSGRLVFVNECAERLLGYSREELLSGQASLVPLGPADLGSLLARAMAAPQASGDREPETRILTRDGRQVFVQWDNRNLTDEAGEPAGWLAVGTDVTARRQAEDALAARVLAEEDLSVFARELLADAPGALARALGRLLRATRASRAMWFVIFEDPELGPCFRLAEEACAPGVASQLGDPMLGRLPCRLDMFQWADTLRSGESIQCLTRDFPQSVAGILARHNIQAILAAPVATAGQWSGFLCLHDNRRPRRFTRQEEALLVTAASILSASLSRPKAC